MATQLIGTRLKALRDARRMSQEELARVFGFKDRQTVSAIETGERRVSAEELLTAVQHFGVPLDYFTDPFMLVGEGKFSWRQTGVGPRKLTAYERTAGRWIAGFRTIAPQVGHQHPLLRQNLKLTRRSSFEEAIEAGERFAAELELGDVPARALAAAMEEKLGILVLMVDALDGISGAACRLPELDVVLINRHEAPGRRNFDLAHELFHILTWQAMPPEHSEEAREFGGNRVEQLADNFASALLMPAHAIDDLGGSVVGDDELIAQLDCRADMLHVTASALKWHLVVLGRLDRDVARAIPDAALRNNGHDAPFGDTPPLFSRPFIEVLARAIDQGRVSLRRAAGLLDLAVEDLSDLFVTHGVEAPTEL